MRPAGFVAVAVALAACPEAQLFEGGFGPIVVQGVPLAAAVPANAPVLTPCAAGWREVDAGAVVCEPWPEGGPHTCAADEAHFPGEPGCARIGSACPAGDWADTLPPGRPTLFVRAGAVGGNGSQGAPFGTLLAATPAATSGQVIALSKGTFYSDGPLPGGVTLFGACVGQTTLTTLAGTSHSAAAISASAGVEVRNLRISGPKLGIAVGGTAGRLHVEDVVVEHATSVGWLAQARGVGTGKNVVLRSIDPDASGNGQGVWVDGAAQLTGSRIVIETATSAGIIASGAGTKVDFSDVAIRDTRPQPSDGKFGRGVDVATGATVTLTRAVVEKSRETGVLSLQGGTLHLTDVVVRDTQVGTFNPNSGHGLAVDTASATGARVWLQHNTGFGAIVGGANSQLTLTDTVAADTVFSATAGAGTGIAATVGGRLTLERVALLRNVNVALSGGSAGTVLTVTDLMVSDTDSGPNGEGGFGATLLTGSSTTLTRARLVGNRQVALLVGSAGTSLVASDLDLRGSLSSRNQEGGSALAVLEGAHAQVARVVIDDNRFTGIYVSDPGTTLIADDTAVLNTRPDDVDGLIGPGIFVAAGAKLTGARVSIDLNQEVGLVATGAGSLAELSDVRVTGTVVPACNGRPICDGVKATGVLVDQSGAAKLTRFLIADNGGFGAQLVNGGVLDLDDGEISGHTLALNVRTVGFDVSRLDHGVTYKNNDRKLDSLEVPLPLLPTGPPK